MCTHTQNERGLKIHQRMMKCMHPKRTVRCKGQPGKTEEKLGQDTHHSPQNLQAQDNEEGVMEVTRQPSEMGIQDSRQPKDTCTGKVRKERVNWPAAASRKEWEIFVCDQD